MVAVAQRVGIAIDGVSVVAAPFAHFAVERCLAPELEIDLIAWLEDDAPWRLVETDFYEQYEFSAFDAELPASCAWLVDKDLLAGLRETMERAFGCEFEDRITLVAHKLLPGQRIAIHNDYLAGEETHRLTVQLNHGLSDADGGFFMLFNSSDPADIYQVLRPVSASAVGFAIGANSYHAVSQLHGGTRYTLVISFYATDCGIEY